MLFRSGDRDKALVNRFISELYPGATKVLLEAETCMGMRMAKACQDNESEYHVMNADTAVTDYAHEVFGATPHPGWLKDTLPAMRAELSGKVGVFYADYCGHPVITPCKNPPKEANIIRQLLVPSKGVALFTFHLARKKGYAASQLDTIARKFLTASFTILHVHYYRQMAVYICGHPHMPAPRCKQVRNLFLETMGLFYSRGKPTTLSRGEEAIIQNLHYRRVRKFRAEEPTECHACLCWVTDVDMVASGKRQVCGHCWNAADYECPSCEATTAKEDIYNCRQCMAWVHVPCTKKTIRTRGLCARCDEMVPMRKRRRYTRAAAGPRKRARCSVAL